MHQEAFAQSGGFEIGAYAVRNHPYVLDTYRVSSAAEMDESAWEKLRELGITMPIFNLRCEAVNDLFPRALIEQAAGHGFHVGLIDDSLGLAAQGERRIFQAEEESDFAWRHPLSTPLYEPSARSDGDFDLPPRLAATGVRSRNVLFIPRSGGGKRLILSGFAHRRDFSLRRLCMLSVRLGLPPGSAPPADTSAILATIVLTAGSDTIAADVRARDLLPRPEELREIFLGYFRPVPLDSMTYGLRWHGAGADFPTYDTLLAEPSSAWKKFPLSRKNSAAIGGVQRTLSPEPGPADFDIKLYDYGAADLLIDQIDVSDEAGYALFAGDAHCLPGHAARPGAAWTPRDSMLQARLRKLLPAGSEGTVRFFELPESWSSDGGYPIARFIAGRIRRLSGDASCYIFSNWYYSTFDRSAEDSLQRMRQTTEAFPCWDGLYSYPISRDMPRVKFDSAGYYRNHYTWSNSTWPTLSARYGLQAAARKEHAGMWIAAIGDLSSMFIDGHVNDPSDRSSELREPSAAELRLQINLALCYGAKAVIQYAYNSFKGNRYPDGLGLPGDTTAPPPAGSSDTLRMGALGFLNYNLTKRDRDTHGENKWDSASVLHRKSKMLGDLLFPLVWDDGFSFTDGAFLSDRRAPVSWIVTERSGVGRDLPAGTRYVEIGTFLSTPASRDTLYLFVVNKRTDSLGGRRVRIIPGGGGMSGRWKVTNLLTGAAWNVRASDAADDATEEGWSDYFAPGDAWLYRLEKSGEAFPPDQFFLGNNYPNPFPSRTFIPLTLPAAGSVRVQLFDLLGRSVLSVPERELDSGPQRIILDTPLLPPGVYLYRIVITATGNREEIVRIGKFMVMR